MPGTRRQRKRSKPAARKKTRRARLVIPWPKARARRRVLRALRRAPRVLQVLTAVSILAGLCFAVNWVYQVIHKPSELFFPVSGTLRKTPPQIWQRYGPLFLKYSTAEITPELLAALAQVEGSGDPVAQTYWRWSWRPAPFEVYRPASSAVGMYQLTNGTFAEAQRYCIRGHIVIESEPGSERGPCWFTRFYSRVIPAHAVELTAAYLDRSVAGALQQRRPIPLERRQELAAVIHLCGAGAGNAYVRRGMRLAPGELCAGQDAQAYVGRVNAARRVFAALRAADGGVGR